MLLISDSNFATNELSELFQKFYCDESDLVTLVKAFFFIYKLSDKKLADSICKANGIKIGTYKRICNDLETIFNSVTKNLAENEEIEQNFDVKTKIMETYARAETNVLTIIDSILDIQLKITE